jgi:NADH-quinone oxidoreductase subunit N
MSPIDPVTVAKQTLVYLLPEILIIAAATAVMTASPFVRWPRRTWAALSGLVLLVAVALVCTLPSPKPDLYSSVVAADAFSTYLRLGILLAGLIILAMAHDQVDDDRAPEFFGGLLMIHAGAMLVATANEMVFLFVGLELVSIPTYLLLYLPRRTRVTQEAATKYFYLSIFASALLLFGLAYLYGLTGISNLKALSYVVHWKANAMQVPQPLFASIALVFVMAGLGFRIAAVPFHFYAPDVYQGSPIVMAALLSWIPKVIGFAAIIRVLTPAFGYEPLAGVVSNLATSSDKALWLTWVLAVVTMTLGNTVALAQDDLKRLLAYSSISHAGYLLIGVAAAFRNGADGPENVLGADAIVFYLATYALMTLGAFGVILALHSPERPVEKVDDLAGLARTRPWAAWALGCCLFSLAGIPPLAGFWGKFRIFQAALDAAHGADAQAFQLLTVIGVINAAIGAFYYLRILIAMTFREPAGAPPAHRAGWPTVLAVGACASLSLVLGLFPGPLSEVARQSGEAAMALPSPLVEATGSNMAGMEAAKAIPVVIARDSSAAR